MSENKVGKTISRLAVVAKDFSTYYIPGHTQIDGQVVNQIDEYPDRFEIVTLDGEVLSKVSKDVPYLVDYTSLYEVSPAEFLIEKSERLLINFGNYLFDKYQVKVMSNDGSNQPLYERKVTDADLCSWREIEEINS